MGILLAFMFIWNMLGALILLPALAYFLLPQANASTERKPRESSLSQTMRNSTDVGACNRRERSSRAMSL
jgi:hypothetical protein